MSAAADLVGKILALDQALASRGVPHAFGGALALAWCTERARDTIDIDLNVFVDAADAAAVLQVLPEEVRWDEADLAALRGDGQTRLWWDATPIDVFLDTTEFHDSVAGRVRHERFAGSEVPFLGCSDLAVFKAFYDRTKDWADLEAMSAAGTLDLDRVLGVLTRYLGGDDHRIERLRRLGS